MYKAASTIFLILPALASASLRGLQVATTPEVERLCNAVRVGKGGMRVRGLLVDPVRTHPRIPRGAFEPPKATSAATDAFTPLSPANTLIPPQTELDTRLDALMATPECATAWPAFSDAMDTDDWTKLSLDEQTEVCAVRGCEHTASSFCFSLCHSLA
jgi:hypothetical protein